MEKHDYIYPVEELDRMIEDINNGIMPMVSEAVMLDIKLRMKEIEAELFEDDDEEDLSLLERHEAVKKKVAESKHSASKEDVIILKISDEKKKELLDDVSTSFVRCNPNTTYNKRDDELYTSNEEKTLQMKLGRLRNCYYRPDEYKNAIMIILQGIRFSLKHNYPWLSEEDAIRKFNDGEIKMNVRIPKLYVNANLMKDKDILKGVMKGDVTFKDRNDVDPEVAKANKKKRTQYKPVSFNYATLTDYEHDMLTDQHNKGYSNPMSLMMKTNMSIYNRYSLPSSNQFAKQKTEQQKRLDNFNWNQPNAGQRYADLLRNKQYTTTDFISDINRENNHELSSFMNTNIPSMLSEFGRDVTEQNTYQEINQSRTVYDVNPEALKIEQNILNSIRINNPNI